MTKDLPEFLFLHGNVWEGGCPKCQTRGYKYQRCWKCGSKYIPSPLLYPIKKKDYNKSDNIRNAWKILVEYLHNAYYVTIFGYNAPDSDVEAKKLLLNAWGDKEKRYMEEFEIIDIQEKEVVEKKWEDFIHTDHDEYHTSFFESHIFRFPRRTVEAYYAEKWQAEWLERKDNIEFDNLGSMHEWFQEIVKTEKKIKKDD